MSYPKNIGIEAAWIHVVQSEMHGWLSVNIESELVQSEFPELVENPYRGGEFDAGDEYTELRF